MKKTIRKLLAALTGVFLPVIGVICAAGVIKGLLMILASAGIISEGQRVYAVLYSAGDAIFWFLPVILSVSAAKSFGMNLFTAAAVGAALLHPMSGGEYQNTVIPALLAMAALKPLESFCYKKYPAAVRDLLTPLTCVAVVGSLTLFVLGPAGQWIGGAIARGYALIYAVSAPVAGAIVAFFIQPMVSVGAHWGLVPVAMNNVAENGYDTLIAFFAPPVFAQAGACLAVALRTKTKTLRTVALSASVVCLLGVTEPALFGVTLRLKRPLLAVCIAGAIGGLFVGLAGSSGRSFAFPSLLTLPVFFGAGFAALLAASAVGMVLGFVLTLILGFEEPEKDGVP